MNLNDHHIIRGNIYRYGLAAVLFTIATTLRLWLLSIDEAYTFVTYYPLIVIAFYLCGRGPGILFILLSSIFSCYELFILPVEGLTNRSFDLIPISSFIVSGALIGFIVTKMQYFQLALTRSQQQHIAILEDQTELICRFKADGTLIYVNDAFCRFFSKTASSLIGSTWQPMVFKDDIEKVEAALKMLSPHNPIVAIEKRVLVANDDIRWGQFINHAFYDDNGELLEIQAVGRDVTEQKQTELENHELLNRLSHIASNVPGVIYQYELTPDGISSFPYVSEAIKNIYQVTPEQVKENASIMFELIHPDDYNNFVTSIQRSAKSLKPWQYEYRIKCLDASIRWLYGNSTPSLETDGSIQWHGFITDITEKKQLEIKLKNESDKNKAFLKNSSDGIHIVDALGNIITVSDSFCNQLGYTRDELMKMNIASIDSQFSSTELDDLIKQLFLTSKRTQFITKHLHKNKNVIDVEVSVCVFMLAEQTLLFCSSRDITERKSLELKIINADKELQEFYNFAPCGYHSLNSDGVITEINDTELQWLGYERKDVIDKMKITDFFTHKGKEQYRITYPELLKYGHIENLEFDLVSKNGNIRTVNINTTAIKKNNKQYFMCRSILYDITDYKKIQIQLQKLSNEQNVMLDNELIGITKLLDRETIWLNNAMAKLFGYTKTELEEQPSSIIFPDEASYEAFVTKSSLVLNANDTFRTQIELVKKNKEKIWVDISGTKLAKKESLWMMIDITPLIMHQHTVEKMAYHDNLTGLPNRFLITDRLTQALAQAKRANQLLAICYLDLDGFKLVNDQYGHAAGDQLLIEVAHRMERVVRTHDTVGRLGGDEFVLLLTHLHSVDEYHLVLTRLLEEINRPFLINNTMTVSVGASIGVALFPQDNADADVLLRYADQAMYRAKSLGRNQIYEYITT